MLPQLVPEPALTVWIVEDHEDYRNTVEELIDELPDMCCTASFSSCEAFLKVLSPVSKPSVVLMDIGFPGMSGIAGILKALKMHPDLAIVMLTIHEDNDKIFDAFCAGAIGYVAKNARMTYILEAIRAANKRETFVSPKIARRVIDVFSKVQRQKASSKDKLEQYNLTSREKEVLNECVKGLTLPQIANEMFISKHTVDSHVRKIYKKLQVHTRQDLIRRVMDEGLL